MRTISAAIVALLATAPLSAQQPGAVRGSVTSEGVGVEGAAVLLTHTETGAQYGGLSQAGGRYAIPRVPAGSYQAEAQMIGLAGESQSVVIASGQTVTLSFPMTPSALVLGGIEVLAEKSEALTTPAAFTTVTKARIQSQLGSRDLPLVLNLAPSVYSTVTGGGAGDARINVRGFNQRNTAVMINGVPVNDMENGWVYWSNWDGLGDAATSIQLQRGMSAINLATPSIGGTLNVITDPSRREPGYNLKQEFGSGNFRKTTMTASTGPVGDFALTASVVRKTGDGIIDGTWTDAWAYYVASQYKLSDGNRLELYAVGAPQRHGQNRYLLNIATLDSAFAASMPDYDPAALEHFTEAGRYWSPNVGGVDPSYSGRQFTSTGPGAGTFSRFDRSFLNERENYFHKPQVNLNWHYRLGEGLTAHSVAYYSGGSGGGTGSYGSWVWDYTYRQRYPDWNATIERNRNSTAGSAGILRNSVNNQNTVGLVTRLQKQFDGDLRAELGLDWRTATIEHYREVRDLLGGTHFDDCSRGCSSDFWSPEEGENRGLGDKIHYHNENDVNWIGLHVQAEKSTPEGSLYGMAGWSLSAYHFTDFFTQTPGSFGLKDPLQLSSGPLTGFQVKGGVVRNATPEWSVYGNAGYVSKIPIFDGVIDDVNGLLVENASNETFASFEVGARFRSLNRKMSLDANVYLTQWNDRTGRQFARDFFGEDRDAVVRLLGMDARHMGFEAEAAYQPSDYVRIDAALSYGDWRHTDNITGSFTTRATDSTINYNFYVDGLYVGDAPQMQLAYALSVFPPGGLYAQLVGRSYGKHYSNWDPFSRTVERELGVQSWRAPGYTVFDFHASYKLSDEMAAPFGGKVKLFVHGFNILNSVYIQDAIDNSRFNGYWDEAELQAERLSHQADDAEVFLGYPSSFNFGFQIYH